MANPCMSIYEHFEIHTDTAPTPIFQVNDTGELTTGTIKQVKQCNSCGAVGKINYECEYCGNTVYLESF